MFLTAARFVAFIMGKDPLDGDASWSPVLTCMFVGLVFLAVGTALLLQSVRTRGRPLVSSATTGYILVAGFGLEAVAVLAAWLI